MSKKHYSMLAEIVSKNLNVITAQRGRSVDAVCRLAEDMATQFGLDNERFDVYRFRAACGYEIKNGFFRKVTVI